MEEKLRLTLLGGMGATLGGSPLDLPYRKSLALLSYLATTGRSHPREALSTLLWGESREDRALASLRTALWHLSESVAPFLVVDRHSVAFNRDAPHWVDAVELERRVAAVRQSRQVNATGRRSVELDERQANVLGAAVDLYGGDFMARFDVRHAPGFEDWVLRKREQSRQLVVWALHCLVNYYTAQGDYGAGLDAVSQLLLIAPWQEEAHRERMVLLALSGRRNAALAQYDKCRHILGEALGAEPTLETELLYREIKAGKPMANRRRGSRPLRLHLPSWCPSVSGGGHTLTGRDSEVARLKRMLIASNVRLTSLAGPEGVGKTRLAWVVTGNIAKRFEQGAYFVSLGPGAHDREIESSAADQKEARHALSPETGSALVCSIGRALGVTFSTSAPLSTQLQDYLHNRELLLVLDGLKPSSAAVDLVVTMLRRAPRIRILIVGTQPLGVEAEQVLWLDRLAIPSEATDRLGSLKEPDLISAYDSVRLFVECARRIAPAFEPTAANAREVSQLCRLTEGLPLAIELAAAWVGKLPLAALVAEIAWRQRRAKGSRRASDCPTAVEAVFSCVWDLLSLDEQMALSRLALIPGEFGSEAALEALEIPTARLQALSDRALLTAASSERYHMHPLLRQLLLRRLRASTSHGDAWMESIDVPHLEKRISAYYLGAVECREASLCGREAKAASAEIASDWWGIRRAWYWAIAHLDRRALRASMGGMSRFLLHQGWFWEGTQLFDAAIERLVTRAETSVADGDFALSCRLSTEKARFLNAQMRHVEAADVAERVIELVADRPGRDADDSPWRVLEARAQLECGKALYPGGAFVAGRHHIKEALALAAEDDGAEVKACGLLHLGRIGIERERFDEARRHLERALHLYDDGDDWLGKCKALSALALVDLGERAYAEAEASLMEALKIAESLGDRSGEAVAHVYLGRIARTRGDYVSAAVHCRHGLHKARDIGEPGTESEALRESAWVALDGQEAGRAWRRSLLAVELARMAGRAADEGRSWLIAGHAFAELAMLEQATRAYERALEVQRQLDQRDAAAESLAGLASISLSQGDLDRARDLVEEILERLGVSGLGGAMDPVSVCLSCYQVLSANRDERAQDMLEMASRMYGG